MRNIRKGPIVIVAIAALMLPEAALIASVLQSAELRVVQNGAPKSGVEVALNLANIGKVDVGTTSSRGSVSFALDLANLGKARVRVVAETCDDADRVWLVGPDGELPPEPEGCRRRVAGAFIWDEATEITVDIGTGMVLSGEAETSGFAKIRENPNFVPAAAMAGAGLVITLLSLRTTGDPSGPPGATCSDVPSDPNCGKSTAGILIGLGLIGGAGYFLYRGNQSQQTAIGITPYGGFKIQHSIRF